MMWFSTCLNKDNIAVLSHNSLVPVFPGSRMTELLSPGLSGFASGLCWLRVVLKRPERKLRPVLIWEGPGRPQQPRPQLFPRVKSSSCHLPMCLYLALSAMGEDGLARPATGTLQNKEAKQLFPGHDNSNLSLCYFIQCNQNTHHRTCFIYKDKSIFNCHILITVRYYQSLSLGGSYY